MRIDKKRYNYLFNYIVVFLLLYVSNDTLLFGTNANRLFFWGQVIILIGVFLLLLISTKKINARVLQVALLLIFMFVITEIVNVDDEIIKYIYNTFLVCLTTLIVSRVNVENFLDAYLDIIYFLACVSIIAFILCLSWRSIFSIFPTIVNKSGDRFFYIGVGTIPDKGMRSIPRMYSIFREPGVYTCFLSLALIIDLFISKNKSIKKTLVISCAMLLTFSTAAFFLLALTLAIYFGNDFFENRDEKGKNRGLFFLLLIFVILLFVIIGKERIWELVFKKLYVENDSFDARLGSIEGNLRMFFSNPISGKGWGYVEDNFAAYTAQGVYKGKHNTNTFLKYLALYGIGPFIIIVTGMINFFGVTLKKKKLVLLCILIWVLTLCNEDLNTNIIFYVIPFYGIKALGTSKSSQPYKKLKL